MMLIHVHVLHIIKKIFKSNKNLICSLCLFFIVNSKEMDNNENDAISTSREDQALLEVKSYFPQVEGEDFIIEDQRDAIKGKEGCLHAKVKQCIRFVKYRSVV